MQFREMVKTLYKHAYMQVAINGVFSTPFHITRGAQQGNPLSSPLFDLAIEPLMCTFRNMEKISDFALPGVERNIKLTLFADKMNLFLNKGD